MVELAPNKIWVTGGGDYYTYKSNGGQHGDILDVSERDLHQKTSIIYENGEWTDGPDLPEGLEGHCMAKLDEATVILSGGENTSFDKKANVYLFDIATGTWTEIDRMPGGSRYDHSCGIAE